jgi:acetate---CoA ligase (ADP-forming)
MNFDKFFNARSIAIIGASRDTRKVGHVILRNLIDQNYKGRIIPINPNAKEILGIRCYPSVTKIKGHVDLAVMAIPAEYVVAALRECAKKGIKNVVIASAGFKEVGNLKLDKELEKTLRKYKMQAIGPNCLGIFNAIILTLYSTRAIK